MAEFETAVTTPQEVGTSTTSEATQTNTTATRAAPSTAGRATGSVNLPSAKLGQIKLEQRERGKREAMGELEAKFKAAGFGSIDDALSAMASLRSGGSQQQASTQQAAQGSSANATQAQARNERRELERLQREREAFAKRYAQEQAQRRQLQNKLAAKEAEMALRETAASKGVRDLDYALRLLQRDLEGLDETALESYDEGAFFDRLRGTHPYLFGEFVVPANTGTGVGAAPAAPKAGQVQQAQGAAGQSDARSMSRDEFQKLLRARGLNLAAS